MSRTIKDSFKEGFKGFGGELLGVAREHTNSHIQDAVEEERIINIDKAVVAMFEAEVPDEKIIELLQKHWDLRRSEAEDFVERAK